MGLIDTLNKLIELCISIQDQLNNLTDLVGNIIHVNRSLVDLSAMDLAALERNVSLLATYREDIDYIIESLEKLSGNIHVLFWLLISVCILVISVISYLIIRIIYDNRKSIYELIERIVQKWKTGKST